MAYKSGFYRKCVLIAWRDSLATANTAAALLGGLVLLLILQHADLKVLRDMEGPTTIGGTVLFTVAMAIVSVGLAWAVIFICRLLAAPVNLYHGLAQEIETLKAQNEPQISLSFSRSNPYCVASLKCGEPPRKARYFRVCVTANGAKVVKECRGFLSSIERKSEGGVWTATHLASGDDLQWMHGNFNAVEVRPDMPAYLNLFFIDSVLNVINPVVRRGTNAAADEFKTRDLYRFNVVVSGENCPSSRLSVTVKQGDTWKDFEVS
jgi:hypothetical protein